MMRSVIDGLHKGLDSGEPANSSDGFTKFFQHVFVFFGIHIATKLIVNDFRVGNHVSFGFHNHF